MEQQSLTWTLNENQAMLRQRTTMLQATWDTMGWIFFRDGKAAEAEPYILAAWQGRQDAEVAGHLAEIALARGDKNTALTDYELASGTFSNYDVMGVKTEPGNAQKEVKAHADALRKQGARTSMTDVHMALQKFRVHAIGPAAGMDGTGEYKLLVKGDSIVRVEPSGDKPLAGGEERLKKTKLPGMIPPGSPAQIMLLAMLNCHSGVCELVVEP